MLFHDEPLTRWKYAFEIKVLVYTAYWKDNSSQFYLDQTLVCNPSLKIGPPNPSEVISHFIKDQLLVSASVLPYLGN
jgi:hypothetical protein